MNPHIVPRFGLPYATVDIAADGSVAHVCPVCGERIPESTDADGEVVTNNYAVHFIQRAEADGTIPPEPPTKLQGDAR